MGTLLSHVIEALGYSVQLVCAGYSGGRWIKHGEDYPCLSFMSSLTLIYFYVFMTFIYFLICSYGADLGFSLLILYMVFHD